ncbi:flagellar basal body-associated protein FliL [Terrilactibacillus sp. S3-3]|nr:flagellar basal body-associated protein FliL [Terrilactibacillus sp. S3-3]
MFKSRGMNILFAIMAVFIVAAIAGFFIVNGIAKSKSEQKHPDIDEIVNNLTVPTDEMTTNLKGDHFAKVKFNIQVSSAAAKDDLAKRTFQVKNAIIYILSGETPSDLQGQTGISNLEQSVKNRINSFLQHGKVTHVYTTEKIVQ